MRKVLTRVTFFTVILMMVSSTALSAPPKNNARSKFYDFNEQIIDGEIKKPTALYTNARQQVKFDRLLKLKKSFMPQLFKTAKEKVFK